VTTLHELARAKINLALHVRHRRADGYHELETLFAFCAASDELRAEPADRLSLTIEGPFAGPLRSEAGAGADNLVLRAARALGAEAGLNAGARFTLAKHLPVASGLGGGSADAAAALRLLDRLWQLDWPLDRLAGIGARLGADVPVCVHSRPMRGEGVGEQLEPIMLPALPLLLVNPGVAVSTAAVFRAWDRVDRGPLASGDALTAAQAGRNDLEAPARALAPAVGAALDSLAHQPGATLVRMSGSGATCFALFETDAARDHAAHAIAADQPGWWVAATHLDAAP
jgi:4-diphosphocytidyl-2-C-methyl-D-erythritol kinase